jgi:glycosyltransferase involved in cell wall biosynthesis
VKSAPERATINVTAGPLVAPPVADAWTDVAVIIPCHNEAASIAQVVADFRRALSGARVVVVDNASTDDTAVRAAVAGAEVVRESRRGKGHAIVRGFSAVRDARYVVMVDGDDTYPADDAPLLVGALRAGADVAIGTRLTSHDAGAYRAGHTFGNRLFILLVRTLFGARTQDLLSGYRAFDQRFLSLAPLIAQGFEVETELTLQALVGGYHVVEVPIHYRARKAGSFSKLSTYRDGYRILLALLAFFRDYRPLTCFGGIGLVLFALAAIAGAVVIAEYLRTGQVLRMPTAVLSVGLGLLGAVSIIGGLLLSSVSRRSQELAALLARR